MNRIDSKGNVMIHVLKVKASFEEISIDFRKACVIITFRLIKRNKGKGVVAFKSENFREKVFPLQ